MAATSPAFPTLTHTAKFLEDPIAFHVLAMDKCLWIWAGPAGSGSATMPNLTVAVNFSNSESAAPSASTLFGATISNPGELVAKRLATKFPETQFFVTLALDESNELLASWAERQLYPLVAQALAAAASSTKESQSAAQPEVNLSR